VEEARQHSAVRQPSLGWQLYLLASAAMFVAYLLWSIESGKLRGPLLAELGGLAIIAMATGLFAFVIAQPTYRRVKEGSASIARARIAVVWPAAVLLMILIIGHLLGI
jgi:hypothetical protein